MCLDSSRHPGIAPSAALVALLLALPASLHADDRDFVRKSAENPYVFILFDVSGSMNWTTACTQAQLDAGDCRQLCTSGDCFAPLNADDPASKFYQAKEALHQVLQQVDNLQLGFATYNQDALTVRSKHWLYEVLSGGVVLRDGSGNPIGVTYPALGAPEVFGRTWSCDTGNGDAEIGCYGNDTDVADLDDPWELARVQRLGKLGDRVDTSTVVYVRAAGLRYRVTYSPKSGSTTLPSPTFTATITAQRCTNSTCSNVADFAGNRQDVTYRLLDELISWDAGHDRASRQRGFFSQSEAADASATDTCNGWDPNGWVPPPLDPYESATDDPGAAGYNLRWPTTNLGDARGRHFFLGDMIPLDWTANHRQEILARLRPDGRFAQAPLFRDHPDPGESFLRLRNEAHRPLLAFGSTPLGSSIQAFRTWYAGCPQGSCPKDSGWKDIAAARDPGFGCRKKYLVVLTDGDETCGGGNSACSATASLRAQEGIRTFVVAFGVQGGGNTLTCMAANGGTGSPIYPQNKQQLVDALATIFTEIKEEARAFASAAVPSVEANVRDKIFLSDFTPLAGESIWDGHLDAFLKPLPVKVDGTPDRSIPCDAQRNFGCHLWDAGAVLETQAPTLAQAQAGMFELGDQEDQRRVLLPDEARTLRLFLPPPTDLAWEQLFRGLGFADAGNVARFGANRARATAVIENTLAIKQATINTIDGPPLDITYVLGDVFHSDPLVLESPRDFDDFANDLFGRGLPCDLSDRSDPGYKCFAFKHQNRRKLLFLGTNDAQLHAFDAGTFEVDSNRDGRVDSYDNGTGREAFSYIPRMALPIVREQAEGALHVFGVDGPVVSGDAFFASDGEWHTLVLGGMREGGRKLGGAMTLQPEAGHPDSAPMRAGYYALDVTQPDPLASELDPASSRVSRFVPTDTDAVPGCLSVDGTTPPGCPRAFPRLLWEFTDRSPLSGELRDEELDLLGVPVGNGEGDLGAPWSRPVLTRVKVLDKDAGGNPITVTRFVVAIAGGLDPGDKTAVHPDSGNWIYLLDVETGEPIYKRQVEGSVPALAVLDSNSDTFADTLYAGTTAGRLYKVDLSTPQPLVDVDVRDRSGALLTTRRVTAPAWDPFVIFRTANDHPIYNQVQVLFVARLGRFALVFGTGDREDLWNFDASAGRLYVMVDEGLRPNTPGLPFTEALYHEVVPDDPTLLSNGANLLLDPTPGGGTQRGWYMVLDPDERVITKAFGVSGILVFSTFKPQVVITQEGQGNNVQLFCSRTGKSRNFMVFTHNGNPVADLDEDAATGLPPYDPPGPEGPGPKGQERYLVLDDFVTSPFVEQAHTQNVSDGGVPSAETCSEDPRLAAISGVLESQGPSNARYGNYFLRLGQRMSKRGIFYPACVPIAVVQRNWREN